MENKRQFVLMHKNTEVAVTTQGDFGEWDVKDSSLLPSGVSFKSLEQEVSKAAVQFCKENNLSKEQLKKLVYDNEELSKDWDALRNRVSLKVLSHNNNAMTYWLAFRVLPIGRKNAKKLHQILGLEQAQVPQEKAKIALSVRGLSIMDNYWITYTGDKKTWDEVDIRKHSLSRGLAVVALTGSAVSLTSNELRDPLTASAELSAHGVYPKGIFREKDGLYMYKSGSLYSVAAEVTVSKILDSSNIFGHVEYFYAKHEGLDCSKCLLMTHSRRDVIHAMALGDNAVNLALTKYRKQIAQMCVVDFLISNSDRHSMNWGFFRESPTWDITGLHWLYDHNSAFDEGVMRGVKLEERSCLTQDTKGKKRNIGLKEAALQMYKYSDFKFIKPIPKSAFKLFGNQADYIIKDFVARCRFLSVQVEIK